MYLESEFLKREKEKSRKLRKTAWWQKKCSSGKCYYCHNVFPVKALTMDHLIPLSRGGRSDKNNLVPCCKNCNSQKKNMLPIEWSAYLENLAEQG